MLLHIVGEGGGAEMAARELQQWQRQRERLWEGWVQEYGCRRAACYGTGRRGQQKQRRGWGGMDIAPAVGGEDSDEAVVAAAAATAEAAVVESSVRDQSVTRMPPYADTPPPRSPNYRWHHPYQSSFKSRCG